MVDDAVISGVYGPLLVGDTVRSPNEAEQRCADATARAATELLFFGFRSRRQVLDRISTLPMAPSVKQSHLDRSSLHIMRIRDYLVGMVGQRCPDGDFQAVYHRSAMALFAALAQRADCLAGAMYVQPIAADRRWAHDGVPIASPTLSPTAIRSSCHTEADDHLACLY